MRSLVAAIALLLALPAGALAKDSAPPTVAFTVPAAGPVAGPVPVTAEASDDVGVARVEFFVNDIKMATDFEAPYTKPLLTGFLPDGPVDIKATAFDGEGQHASTTRILLVDNTKPALSLDGPDKARFLPGTTQTWKFNAADGGSGIAQIRCSVRPLDTPPVYGSCPSAKEFVLQGQAEGLWTFTVLAADAAGNHAQQARDIMIDGTPPDTTILSGPDGESTLSWELDANENATFECRIVPAAFAPCSGGTTHIVSGLAPGEYVFEARATDLTGNVDPSPSQSAFTVAAAAAAPAPAAATAPTETLPEVPQIEVALSFRFTSTKAATKLAGLIVKNIPAGATVTVNCPHGCARKTYRKVKRTGGKLLLTPVLKKKLAVGTEITVTVSKPGLTSAVKVLTIRARKAPLVTTLCQPEGSSEPAAC